MTGLVWEISEAWAVSSLAEITVLPGVDQLKVAGFVQVVVLCLHAVWRLEGKFVLLLKPVSDVKVSSEVS